MNSFDQSLFDGIISLIDEKDFSKAECELKAITSSENVPEKAISYAFYLYGYIHTLWENKNKKPDIGKVMLLKCIESNFPIPDAYSLYADYEADKTKAVNYLKAGLNKFPENSSIYLGLLRYCIKDDAIKYINDIEEKNINSINLLKKVIELLVSISNWERAECFLQKLLDQIDIPGHDRLYCEMLYLFSFVMQEKKIEEAKNGFLGIIEKDLSNDLKYSPYMGYIWCCAKLNLKDEVAKYLDRIPFSNGLDDLMEGPWCIIAIDFHYVYKGIFGEIASVLADDKERMLRLVALEAYYLYLPSESYDIYRYTKKHLNVLKRYLKLDRRNQELLCAIYNMQKHFHLYYDAYKTYTVILNEYYKPEEKDIYGIDFLNDCSTAEIEHIFQDVLSILKAGFDMDFKDFIPGIFDNIVEYLYKSKDKDKYIKICTLSNEVRKQDLYNSEKLFEIAYSYAELDGMSQQAESLYLHFLKAVTENSGVFNNLGVIYETRLEIQKAKEYFQKAHELDSSKALYKKNLHRVTQAIKEDGKALKNAQNENAWFLSKLLKIYEEADVKGELACTYKDRSKLLSVSPQKADELFKRMMDCGYLKKIITGNSDTPNKYSINSLVKEYLLRENERIEANKYYESLGEKLNIDEMNNIGFTKELLGLISSSIGTGDLLSIILRDLRECAISLITNQHKSCIVVCGSIIEALLVYRIEEKGLYTYDVGALLSKKSKVKSVKEMSLNELLDLAREEQIIDKEAYHLANYVRFYRNTIHPSCEVRKNYEVSEDTAKLMWSALLAIIKELIK